MLKTNWWFIPFLYLISIWLVFILQQQYDFTDTLALYPRDRGHLIGIITTVFLHNNLVHIASNSLPLIISLLGLFYFYREISIRVTLICHLLTGILIWIFARPAYHIGASGLVYALVVFLLTSGFIRKNRQLKFLALAVLSIQSGLLWGVIPQGNNISWESHLMGAIVGIATAFIYKNQGPPADKKFQWNEDPHPHEQHDEYEKFGHHHKPH
ncbi:MAG: rhomboid family intramembrane serine protease [bacterium]|nr:rhomboid family intramembrane serine protease [bacterium]